MSREGMETIAWNNPTDDFPRVGTRGQADVQKLAKGLSLLNNYFLSVLTGTLFNCA